MKANAKTNNTLITVSFESDKLTALEMYIKDENLIDAELKATMDKLYNRYVPPAVKQYLADSQDLRVRQLDVIDLLKPVALFPSIIDYVIHDTVVGLSVIQEVP